MTTNKQLTVRQAHELFIRKCRVKNLTDNTIESYERKCLPFFEFYGTDNYIDGVSVDTVDDYTLWLKDKGTVNDISINSYLRSLRAFLYYCMEYGYCEQFKIKLTKAEKKIKETYTDDELAKLLVKPPKDCTFSQYKTWVFINYLLGTGNRISTALDVRISDINFADGVIMLRKVKNRKQQIIPLARSLSNVLKEYMRYRGGEPEDYLFCNDYGQHAGKRTYQQLIHDYNLNHGVQKSSCHLFRHTFAKNWIMNNGDIFRLQKILGHSDLTVTKEYVALWGTDLIQDFDKFNPLDRLTATPERIKM